MEVAETVIVIATADISEQTTATDGVAVVPILETY